MKRVYSYLALAFTFFHGFSQSGFETLREEIAARSADREQRVMEYVSKNNLKRIFTINDVTYAIHDIVNDRPVYIKTDNDGAATTTGADVIGLGGESGLGLDGSGIFIGVWDGGAVRTSHVEFTNRVIIGDEPAGISGHGTHVMGTILAAGVDGRARGMAVGARAVSYDFNNPTAEMATLAREDQSGLVFSNNSWGFVTGWDDGTWFGDPNISDQEDYRFGYYSEFTQSWDELTYAAPYLSIIKSAGNDRNDSGDGSFPPDGPYDIIGSYGNAKNIFTIGAVNKIPGGYDDPSDVVMSSFSGWGPTDDGRIKPDFVAAGVNLISAGGGNDNQYQSRSGTSMSAPNATGTLVLLQQLHRDLNGSLMRSSTLKAVVAHTIHEAGLFEGPDYQHGWGLINAVDAAELMVQENGTNRRIDELILNNGENLTFRINPLPDTKVTATICWIDLPGEVPTPSLDPEDLILVNDLDMRITSPDTVIFPWILDPANPNFRASRGDNFRDNIEKIEFIASESAYDVAISHKGELVGGSQAFSLVVSYESDISDQTIFYWVGEDEDLGNPVNWSDRTGGESTGSMPGESSTLIFDNNSFSNGFESLALSEDLIVDKLLYLASNEITINTNGNKLVINSNYKSNNNLTVDGEVVLSGLPQAVNALSSGSSLLDAKLSIDCDGCSWVFNGTNAINELNVIQGDLDISNSSLEVESLTANDPESSLFLINADLGVRLNLSLAVSQENYSDTDATFIANGEAISMNFNQLESEATIEVDGSSEISGLSRAEALIIDGVLSLNQSGVFKSLSLERGAQVELQSGSTLNLDTLIIDNDDVEVAISSNGTATITIDRYQKLCFDHLNIENVNLTGQAVVSVGANSLINNAKGWVEETCDNTLFADFTASFTCSGSLVQFTNLSSGPFEQVAWSIPTIGNSDAVNAEFLIEEAGSYDVSLVVTSASQEVSYTQTIEIATGNLEPGIITNTGDVLFSEQTGDAYQWYRNGQRIEGAVDRFYMHENVEGEYFVVVFIDDCNAISESIFLEEVLGFDDSDFVIYPNPTSDIVFIHNPQKEGYSYQLLDGTARLITSGNANETAEIGLSGLNEGIYYLQIESGERVLVKKIVVKR
jgi:hypothetical protein